MKRTEILDSAKKIVCGEREQQYGSPEYSFKIISEMWSAYLGYPVNESDVAAMMALLKIARISTGRATADSWIDLAGYAACGGEIDTSDDEHE